MNEKYNNMYIIITTTTLRFKPNKVALLLYKKVHTRHSIIFQGVHQIEI